MNAGVHRVYQVLTRAHLLNYQRIQYIENICQDDLYLGGDPQAQILQANDSHSIHAHFVMIWIRTFLRHVAPKATKKNMYLAIFNTTPQQKFLTNAKGVCGSKI